MPSWSAPTMAGATATLMRRPANLRSPRSPPARETTLSATIRSESWRGWLHHKLALTGSSTSHRLMLTCLCMHHSRPPPLNSRPAAGAAAACPRTCRLPACRHPTSFACTMCMSCPGAVLPYSPENAGLHCIAPQQLNSSAAIALCTHTLCHAPHQLPPNLTGSSVLPSAAAL